jgi:hypothetical protein
MPDDGGTTTISGNVSYDAGPPSDTYDTNTTLIAQVDYTSLDGETSDTVYNDPSNMPSDIQQRLNASATTSGGGGGGSSQKGQAQKIIILNDTKAAMDILNQLQLGGL